jgi:hypothetical protein
MVKAIAALVVSCAHAQVLKFENAANSACTISMNAENQLESSCAFATPSGSLDARVQELESALLSGYLCAAGSDISSNDLSSHGSATHAECETACSEDSACKGFTMPGCNLKSSGVTGSASGVTACKRTLLATLGASASTAGKTAATALHSCNHLLDAGVTIDGAYWIDPTGVNPVKVWCDMTTEGGGEWSVIGRVAASLPALPLRLSVSLTPPSSLSRSRALSLSLFLSLSVCVSRSLSTLKGWTLVHKTNMNGAATGMPMPAATTSPASRRLR